jgi:hypothetical protein
LIEKQVVMKTKEQQQQQQNKGVFPHQLCQSRLI